MCFILSNCLLVKFIVVYFQNAQSIVIPQLVQKALPESSVILRQLATHLKVNYRKDLLLLNFNFIFSYLVRTCSGAELKEALAFVEVCVVAYPARQFSPAMQISNYYRYSFLLKLIVFTVNEHENICIAGINRRAGYATVL